MIVTAYCSGSIPKASSDYADRGYWTDVERHSVLIGVRPHEVRFLRPDDELAALGNSFAMFGRDMYQLRVADFVIVDARTRRGMGVGIEILASRLVGTPLVIVAPPNTHYRRDELTYRGTTVSQYVHPHLESLADGIVDSFESAGLWIKDFIENPTRICSIGSVYEAIEAYKREVLHEDEAMAQLMLELETLGGSRPRRSDLRAEGGHAEKPRESDAPGE